MRLRRDNFCGLILAAGLGTRLRPLTESVPKPLLPICGTPLIQIIMEKLSSLGISRFAMNTHYKPEIFVKFLDSAGLSGKVTIFHEEKILGTGGVLPNCREFLERYDHFILHNGDIVAEMDFEALIHRHLSSGASATMALIDGPENRVLSFGGSIGDICGRLGTEPPSTSKLLTYSGISVFSRRIFEHVPPVPTYITLVDILLDAISSRPGSVKGFVPQEFYWNDVGTFERYHAAHREIILERKMRIPGVSLGKSARVASNSPVPKKVHLGGFLCVGKNVQIAPDARLKNCVILDDVSIGSRSRHCDETIATGGTYHRDRDLIASLKITASEKISDARISTLAEQGSARKFYRICRDGSSKVLMLSSREDKDFARFSKIGGILQKHALSSPEIYAVDEEEYAILMEDLGDGVLHDLIKERSLQMEPAYRKILDWLFRFHLVCAGNQAEFNDAVKRHFDFSGIRWESEYFAENYLRDFLSLPQRTIDRLNPAFDALAEAAMRQPQLLVHRDFQSQNIMIKNSEVRIIDFQGARLGPLCYDMMSLLWDPYVPIPKSCRISLMKYYFAKFADDKLPPQLRIDASTLMGYALVAGMQRIMQALGAYCFLSKKLGKKQFLKHIGPGAKRLSELLDLASGNPGVPQEIKKLQFIY